MVKKKFQMKAWIGPLALSQFWNGVNPLPDDNILDWSKLKKIADDIFKFIQNGKQVQYRVVNVVRKGEIACYKQFLLFSQCFLQLYIFSASKCNIVW